MQGKCQRTGSAESTATRQKTVQLTGHYTGPHIAQRTSQHTDWSTGQRPVQAIGQHSIRSNQPSEIATIRPGRNWAGIAGGTWESKPAIPDIRLKIADLDANQAGPE